MFPGIVEQTSGMKLSNSRDSDIPQEASNKFFAFEKQQICFRLNIKH